MQDQGPDLTGPDRSMSSAHAARVAATLSVARTASAEALLGSTLFSPGLDMHVVEIIYVFALLGLHVFSN